MTDGVELLPLAPRQVEQQRAAGAMLVDVRTDQQFDDAHIPGAVAIPMLLRRLRDRLAWLADREQEIVLVGRDDEDGRRAAGSPSRSASAGSAGYLHGGMTSWRQEHRPVARIERLAVDDLPAAPEVQLLDVRERASGTPATSPARCSRPGTTSTRARGPRPRAADRRRLRPPASARRSPRASSPRRRRAGHPRRRRRRAEAAPSGLEQRRQLGPDEARRASHETRFGREARQSGGDPQAHRA